MLFDEYITLDAAAALSGMHPHSLKRLLRAGAITGSKDIIDGRRRWTVSRRSLQRYMNVIDFGDDRPGPKPYLTRRE